MDGSTGRARVAVAPFLICATPRSGSAWLANFLTYDGCMCVHEPLVTPLPPSGHRIRGGVDTGAAYLIDDIRRTMPGVRLYQLRRNEAAVRRSLEALGLPYMATPDIGEMTWHFEDLFHVEQLRAIWAEIVGTPFDAFRAAQLIEFNVQHDLQAQWRRIEGRM